MRRGRAAARSAAEDRCAARGARRVRSRSCALGSEAAAAAAAGGRSWRRRATNRLHARAVACARALSLAESKKNVSPHAAAVYLRLLEIRVLPAGSVTRFKLCLKTCVIHSRLGAMLALYGLRPPAPLHSVSECLRSAAFHGSAVRRTTAASPRGRAASPRPAPRAHGVVRELIRTPAAAEQTRVSTRRQA